MTAIDAASDMASVEILSSDRKQWLEDLLNRWQIPNLGIAITRKGESGWEQETYVYGPRSPDSPEPMLDSHLFAIASNSKYIAAIALSMLLQDLADQGVKLNGSTPSWKTKVRDILPDFVLQDKYVEAHVTLEDMLSMNWGMPRHDHAHKYRPPSVIPTQIPHFRFSTELRQLWQYCNIGYNLTPLIFNRFSPSEDCSKAFTEFVQKRIFDPLGLSSATYDAEGAVAGGQRIEGAYRVDLDLKTGVKEFKDGEFKRIPSGLLGRSVGIGPWTDFGSMSDLGAGGVLISLHDLAKYSRALLEPPEWLAPHLAKVNRPRAISKPSADDDLGSLGSLTTYGLGQMIWYYRGNLALTHGGGQHGQISWPIRLPEKGLSIWVITGEVQWSQELIRTVALTVLDDLLGETTDWERRIWYASATDQNEPRVRPKEPLPDPQREEVEGEYNNPGYGTISIKLVDANTFPELFGEPLREVERCGISCSTVYAARIDAIFESHILLIPWSGRILRGCLMSVYPRRLNYMAADVQKECTGVTGGKNHVWKVDGFARCVVTGDGLGMFERFRGPGTGAGVDIDDKWMDDKNLSDVKDKAEVWFDRL